MIERVVSWFRRTFYPDTRHPFGFSTMGLGRRGRARIWHVWLGHFDSDLHLQARRRNIPSVVQARHDGSRWEIFG